jgi:hypothetical protein
MIEILPAAFLIAEMGKVAVIVIEMKVRALEFARQFFRQSRFSGTGTASNA